MNEQIPGNVLPELSPESIDRIEDAVFADIARARLTTSKDTARSRARRRRWLTGLGVAAAFAAGILVAPPIAGLVGNNGYSLSSDHVASDASGGSAEIAPMNIDSVETAADAPIAREIIQNAHATLMVDDIREAADAIEALADEHGGYVESTDIGTAPASDDESTRALPESDYGSISIRVPSAELSDVLDDLASTGELLATSRSQHDVTSTAIDLRARVDATRASVERLTELMTNTATVSELIEAEMALSERQAQLESYEQQLAALEDQVEMSSLHVTLTRTASATSADPAGFTDGLLAGWNGLIVSLNAVVIAIGFVLPWLAVVAVVVLIVWLVRRRRRTKPSANASDD